MSAPRVGGVLVLTVILLGLVVGSTVALDAPVDRIDTEHELDIDADEIVLRVDLMEDGDATVSTDYRIALDSEADRDAFDELATEIAENEERYLEDYETRFGPVVSDAAAATEREMEMVDLTVSTDTRSAVDRQYGVVTFSFTWTAFAIADSTELTAGDALDGLFLTEETNLVFHWPESYVLTDVAPDPDAASEHSLSWSGPREFSIDEPRLYLSSDSEAEPIDDEPSDDGLLVPAAIAGILLLLIVAVGAWWYRRRSTGGDASSPTSTTDSTASELLSNEERVLKLVEERGGRMKQQEVADELDWTAAKTSKVVSNLRESGDLEAFRLGRENVIRLPEEGEEL